MAEGRVKEDVTDSVHVGAARTLALALKVASVKLKAMAAKAAVEDTWALQSKRLRCSESCFKAFSRPRSPRLVWTFKQASTAPEARY